MQAESIEFNFLSFFSIIAFFITLVTHKFSNKIGNGILLDQDFDKPQAFHKEPIARSGGIASMISLIVFISIYYFLFGKMWNDYLFLPFSLFVIGFFEDIKLRTNPNIRLILMIIVLIISTVFLSINIDNMEVPILKTWMQNRVFETIFILLCFLFIINGANLIDGFNGLLAIHLIIINFVLLLINIGNDNTELALVLAGQIAILFSFLLFNFPNAKVFLGDSGSYLFGSLIVLNIIETNNLNPEISSFFFCILLFYLFFEVFFSFFRKLYLKRSPMNPDQNHLHMLLFNYLEKWKNFKNPNYLNSLIINIVYLSLILPSVYFRFDGLICRYWFFFLLALYILLYFRLYSFAKK